MKRPLLAIALMIAAAATPLPSFAHSDVSVRVNLGWPVAPAVVYYDAWRPAPYPVYYEPEYRPVVIYREYEGRHHRGHHRGRGHGHYAHHHDRHCRH